MSSQKRTGSNAFERLMHSSKKPKASRFVLCPAGCGAQVPEIKINEHLDTCFQRSSEDNPNDAGGDQSPDTVLPKQKRGVVPAEPHHGEKDPDSTTQAKQIPTTTMTTTTTPTNAFSHMMSQSKKVFSDAVGTQQCFHLHDDLSVTWTKLHEETPPAGIIWTASIQLRREKSELLLTTSVVPEERPALVKKHSRLSVPVLKSILQKAVRRRRPLPATRAAMEIVDKDIGELLRRLPIIILEDSTLHPELPLLVWLMAAESKGYKLSRRLVTKVLQIVHETASCPWTDDVVAPPKEDIDGSTESTFSLPPECETMLRAIHLRAQYGGMACDVSMLKLYKDIWNHRFQVERLVPKEVLNQIGHAAILDWKDLPLKIHQRAKQQSEAQVPNLVQLGVPRLELKDICIEGIDFHCSPILDQVISHPQSYQDCIEFLSKDGFHIPGNQREWLMGILKQCMWQYSSGVNHRRSITGQTAKKDDDNGGKRKQFWKDLVDPKAQAYMKKYIEDRLG
jgi:hypothetical protein